MKNRLAHPFNIATSVAVSNLTAWRGTSVIRNGAAPKQRLKLFDMEGCPYCRSVREVLTALGLDADIYPCPKGGQRFRKDLRKISEKAGLPLLIDPNTKTTLTDATAIIDYLFATYGNGKTPRYYRRHRLAHAASVLGSAVRQGRGLKYRAARAPEKRLELWSFESSPFSRLVRERLTELELPYVLHNIGKEQFADMGPAVMRVRPGPYRPKKGGKREQILAQFGRVQAPYLEDPNTGTKLYESADIIDYLERQYAV